MNQLKLVKSEMFGQVQADFYSKQNEVYMTSEQLGECLGYSQAIKSVSNLADRNPYLKEIEFSVVTKLMSTDGKQYDTRIFTEDGIYEVTMLAKTEKAKEFRAWVRTILKSLRTGKAKIVGMTEYQQMVAKTREANIRVKEALIFERLSNQYDGTYKQVLQAHVTKALTGEFILPLPELGARTFSAKEIGDKLGISANMVGKLANANGLKCDKYGSFFKDKAKGCNKEVSCFRYFESVVPELRKFIEG